MWKSFLLWAFVMIVGLTISQLPGWAGQGVRNWMMDIPQSTHDFTT